MFTRVTVSDVVKRNDCRVESRFAPETAKYQ